MVLRLLAHNAEHWLSGHLNAYLRDDDEYRAITRQTIIRGLAGTITYAPAAITVTLEQPASWRVARALELLLDEINADRPPSPATPAPSTTRSPRTAFNATIRSPPEIWVLLQARCEPGAPGCLPGLRPPPFLRPALPSGGLRPGWSSIDGGRDEFPLLRDSRCSSRSSFAASFSLASIRSATCPASAVICPS